MANYPWQRLVDAVRRACNLSVVPPLQLSQSMSGTVLSLPPTFEQPLYAVKSSSTVAVWLESSGLFGSRYVADLDTQIHRAPDDGSTFSLDATYSEVSVSQPGYFAFGGWGDASHDAQGAGEQLHMWLEEAAAGAYDADTAWTEIFGTKKHFGVLNAQREDDAQTFYVQHLLTANKKYRVRLSGGYTGDPTILNAFAARLQIQRLRQA